MCNNPTTTTKKIECAYFDKSDLAVRMKEEFQIHHLIDGGLPWFTLHDVALGRFKGERNGGEQIGSCCTTKKKISKNFDRAVDIDCENNKAPLPKSMAR